MVNCTYQNRKLEHSKKIVLQFFNMSLAHLGQKFNANKEEGNDQDKIQSSTTPDSGYQWESDNVTTRHHKREPRDPLFPGR